MNDDVRDIRGRLIRIAVSIPLGVITAFAVTISLPTRDHFERMACCVCSTGWVVEGGSPAMMIAGVIAAALAWCGVLTVISRRLPRATVRLPRARVVR